MTDGADNNKGQKTGAAIKVFGLMLVFLGVLNVMLSFKSGGKAGAFDLALIATGAFTAATGLYRSYAGRE